MLFTPHPDDDTFCCGGTLALLAKNNNKIHIVIYTNDDKGSYDPAMTSERLARIRMLEEEQHASCSAFQNPASPGCNFTMACWNTPIRAIWWSRVTGLIRKVRPDAVLAPDPGSEYVRWHKTDHRMAANIRWTAIRAAEWHLYFPNQRLHDGLAPWAVPMEFYYYVTDRTPITG